VSEPADIAENRARLAELDAALVTLRAQFDLSMNAFKFDEARALVPQIEAAERDRRSLAENLPPLPPQTPAPYTVTRQRRRRR
jgi:hypothetical protein